MTIALVSLLVLGVGLVVSRIVLGQLAPGDRLRDPHAWWSLGLVTPLPAWLVAFLGLLGTQERPRPQLVSTSAWVLSAALALIGAIATEARVRAAGESVESGQASRLWWLGVLAFIPAWAVAVLGHLLPH
ncbi:MAG TPA: hypothetical protein VLV15_08190 [Dongiaceae bacterium]|nr:hypothetical protein [Dongiaceae bacterium]